MMRQAIEHFNEQFSYEPVIENSGAFHPSTRLLVLGMGGSQWPANLLHSWKDGLVLFQHRDYGLPHLSESEFKNLLVVASSFSGNTEEPISGLEEALKRNLPVLIVAAGGKLLAIAKEQHLAYIQLPIPGDHFQPRMATALMMKAFLAALGDTDGLAELTQLKATIDPRAFEPAGKKLASSFDGKVPVIYASRRNGAIARTWKIKLNETGKIPAFFNVLPEHNHNELNGFDVTQKTKILCQPFQWVFLTDEEDHPRIIRRFDVLEGMLNKQGLSVDRVPLAGSTRPERIFGSTLTADWFAMFSAEQYGMDPTDVPMVEEFKKLIAS